MSKIRVFSDGIDSVSLTDGLIRMELYNVSPRGENTPGGTAKEISGELIMTPQGFIRAFAAMEDLVNQLVAAGIIKRNTPNGAGTAAEPEESAGTSPNFS